MSSRFENVTKHIIFCTRRASCCFCLSSSFTFKLSRLLSRLEVTMTDVVLPDENENLLDYDEEDAEPEQQANGAAVGAEKKAVKGNYVSIHSSGFRDFLLKPELLRAIVDCGFEHPSEGKKLSKLTAAILIFFFNLSLSL